MSETKTAPDNDKRPYKAPYTGYPVEDHDCEGGGMCHGCLAHFMQWRNDPRPVGRPIQPYRIPILGSINEPKLEAEGWRIVRDPDTGYALYEEEIDRV